jgi:hypothetical protein
MVAINLNLTNFNNVASFMNIFSGFDNDFEITSDGVLRQKNAPPCHFCGTKMNQNGYNMTFGYFNLSINLNWTITPQIRSIDHQDHEPALYLIS